MQQFINNIFTDINLPLTNPILIFSLILFIILLAPILLKKISIPGIIGLIISGIIIGPKGLNILEKNSAIDLFSTIGLLYIMFIAGLDLDLNQFKSNRNKSLLFGFLTFFVPLAIGFPVFYYGFNYSFNASMLIAIMFSTQTLIAYPIVSKFGITKLEPVTITVGGTIFTDTAVLIVLAIIMGNSTEEISNYFWIRLTLSLIIFFVIMFFVIPRIAKWFFCKLESEKHSHYIFVLAVVFFAAFLAELAGIEPIIGAFVAGLSLNRLIPHSSALMNRIEFIGNSLFIPFFLISVGMIVDISVLFEGTYALIIIVVLSLVAILGKWLAAFLTRIILAYTRLQGQLIFGLSTSHAAAVLAVALVGYRAGILDNHILNATVILILVSCIVASFVTENASRKLAILDSEEKKSEENSVEIISERLLIPVANISNIPLLLEFAFFIKNHQSPHPVSLLSCIANDANAENNIIKNRNQLEKYALNASASENKIDIIVTLDHNPASGISRISKEIMADIIIMGWPQRAGMLEKLIGDKVENITKNTDKTIFITFLNKALISNKKIIVIVPPLAENESGFSIWYNKVLLLSKELNLPIEFFCSKETMLFFSSLTIKRISKTKPNYVLIDNWDDLLIAKDIRRDDLIVLVTSRKGSVSYKSFLDNLPSKLETFYQYNSKILIYPQRFAHHYKVDGYESYASNHIEEGIGMVKKITKNLEDLIKGDKK